MSIRGTPTKNSTIISKSQLGANVTTTWHTSKPVHPNLGDAYIDYHTYNSYIYDGNYWILFGGIPEVVKSTIPTEDDLEKFPSLRVAWEEYLSIKKLLGV